MKLRYILGGTLLLPVTAAVAALAITGGPTPEFLEKQAAQQSAKKTAPVESKFGSDKGPLTMDQRVARANHHNLQAKCASHLSESLKDPNSIKIVDGSYGARGDRKVVVNLTYTATNSFGGRVKEQNSCTYTF